MAYISSEDVKDIRNKIKKAVPNWKVSVTRHNYSTVVIKILQAPVNLLAGNEGHENIHNPYYSRHDARPDVNKLKEIYSIANKGNHDNSDIMTDYFDVGWYIQMSIGSWDKDFIIK